MAEYNTIRVGELPPAPWGMTNLLPKEVAGNLTRGTVQQLADLISDYIGTASSLAFNPTTILDGGTLPDTDSPEWVLVGKGTFYNVNGGATITTTEELNALTSNGMVWALSVEIPINVELAGIVQSVRSGYTTTAPSEDAVFNAIAQSIPEGTEMLVNKQNSLVPDPSGVKYITANAVVNGLEEKQNTLILYTVGGNQTVSDDWYKNTIVFTTSGTITVPDNLSVSFYFNGITLPGVSLTWVLTGDTTWVSGDPGITTENKRFSFAKKGAEESIIFIADEDSTVLTSTDELAEGITNLYFTTARVLSTVLTGLSTLTGTAIVPTDTVLVALGKLQKQINDKQDLLVSGTNIKTINGYTILGNGNIAITTYKYILQYLPNPGLSVINTWYGWGKNASNMLTQNPNVTAGTGTEPTKLGTWFADNNVLILKDVKKLIKLTLQIREALSTQTLQIYVVVADYGSARGSEVNGQIVVNDTFATSAGSYLRDLTILTHADFNENSVMYVFMRCTSGTVSPQAFQLLYKLQDA